MKAGRNVDVRVGAPQTFERIESGLLSFLSDITLHMTPFKAGLGKLCEMPGDAGCAACSTPRRRQNPYRQLRRIEVEGGPLSPQGALRDLTSKGKSVGQISSLCRANGFDCNVAFGRVDGNHLNAGMSLKVRIPVGPRAGIIQQKFWDRFS